MGYCQDEDNTGNPYLGEWIGIPMSEAGKLRAAAWSASIQTLPECSAALTVQRISRAVHPSCVFGRKSIPSRAPLPRFTQNGCARLTIPSISTAAPIRHRMRSHLGRLRHGRMDRRHTQSHRHAPQRGLPAPQRRSCQRSGHHDRISDAPWRHPHLDHHRVRSCLSHRTRDPSSEYRLALNQQIPPYPCTVIEEVDRPMA